MKKLPGAAILMLALNLMFCEKAVPQFDGNRAFGHLEKQCSFGPRVPGSEAAKQCLDYFEAELKPLAETVVRQPFVHYDKYRDINVPMTNLLASFNNKSKARVLLAAHWDSRLTADRDPDPANHNTPILGANDGASGVAVLLEIARHLKANPPEIGVDIVLFDGEDYGPEGDLTEYFLGSRHFAENAGNYRPRFGILLDMVGDADLHLPVEGYSKDYLPHIVDKVWQTAESLGYSEFDRAFGGYVHDDHQILIEHGIPCIDIIDFAYPNRSHSYWHTLEDTPDKCSPQSLETVGQVLLQVIYNESE
jgi:glutaminyl-peptide cyclotransferase